MNTQDSSHNSKWFTPEYLPQSSRTKSGRILSPLVHIVKLSLYMSEVLDLLIHSWGGRLMNAAEGVWTISTAKSAFRSARYSMLFLILTAHPEECLGGAGYLSPVPTAKSRSFSPFWGSSTALNGKSREGLRIQALPSSWGTKSKCQQSQAWPPFNVHEGSGLRLLTFGFRTPLDVNASILTKPSSSKLIAIQNRRHIRCSVSRPAPYIAPPISCRSTVLGQAWNLWHLDWRANVTNFKPDPSIAYRLISLRLSLSHAAAISTISLDEEGGGIGWPVCLRHSMWDSIASRMSAKAGSLFSTAPHHCPSPELQAL